MDLNIGNTVELEKEYSEIIKNFESLNLPFVPIQPQWNGPNDFLVKFSLYQETPNSITSTDTLATI